MPVDHAAAARLLLDLRATGRTVPDLPGELRPATIDEGYDIQTELHRQAGWTIGAIKVGATGAAAQQAMGLDHPFGAVVPSSATFPTGTVLDRAEFHHVPFLECEFAMRVAVDVVDAPDVDADPRALADALAPAVELACSRYDPMLGASVPSLIADNGVNAALVLGEPVAPIGDLLAHPVVLRCGDEQLAAGTGAAVLGDPYRSFAWAIRHELARGRPVPAGTWVITGSCTGLTPCPLDREVTADFGSLGVVSLTLTS